MTSKATTANPKDLLGIKKPPLHLIPSTAEIMCSLAFADGAGKYGAYNWRDKAVVASIYVAAGRRHFMRWFERERDAKDSGVHHLGHAMACAAILIDAEYNDALVDDRPGHPVPGDVMDKLFADAERILALMAENHAKLPQNQPSRPLG